MWAADQPAEYWINGIVLSCVAAIGITGKAKSCTGDAEPAPQKEPDILYGAGAVS
jgi:hypothetical protein